MKIYLTFYLAILCAVTQGQDLSVPNRINLLFDTASAMRRSNPTNARDKLREAINLSSINGNFRLGQLAYLMGDLFLDVSEFDSAYAYYGRAIEVLKEDDPTLGRAYFGRSYVEYFKGWYDQSLASVLEAERKARQLNDKVGLARALKLIGSLAEMEEDFRKSKNYFEEALAIVEELKDTLNIVRTLNSLASPYQFFKQYEKSEEVLLRAVMLAKKIDCQKCLAVSYSQLGINYFYWKKYEQSIRYYKLEQAINRRLGDPYTYFFPNQNIAESLVELGRLDQALVYNDSAVQIALDHQANQLIHDAYKVRYSIFKRKGDIHQALLAFEKQMQYKDSLYTSEKASITESLKVQYETERREQKITELEQQKQIKELEAATARQWQIGLLAFLVLLAIVVGVLYNRYQLKQQTAKQLDEKNVELQKLNGFKDRMFAVISHDLRNPVDAFNTIIESLNQNLQHASKEELSEFLEATLQSAKDLKSLLNNLLEWSMVQIGKLPFNPGSVAAHDVAAESIRHVDTMARAKEIHLENQIGRDTLIRVDKAMTTIVLRNLLTNAVKYSPVGTSVKLSATQNNGSVILSVRDEGPGMSPEDVGKLFKMEGNTRSIGNSAEKGAGIGLLLCKELVERNSGKISVDSNPGTGSTFLVELPSA